MGPVFECVVRGQARIRKDHAMIQDIAPKKLYNEYNPQKPEETDFIAVFSENKILIKDTGGRLQLPGRAQLKQALLHPQAADTYLFRLDQTSYFLYQDQSCAQEELNPARPEFQWIRLPDFRAQADHELCFAVYTAFHLYRWYKNHRFCGCCGTKTVPDTKERMLSCPACGNQIYPVIAPAVIAAVTHGDHILLTKYAGREYKRYALIAGFTEIGETAEDTVRREVMEEAGIRVKNIRYYKSQPWGIDGNLLLGYFAELDGSDQISLDETELASAEWVRRDQLKDMDDSFSLTREMMRAFYEKIEPAVR